VVRDSPRTLTMKTNYRRAGNTSKSVFEPCGKFSAEKMFG